MLSEKAGHILTPNVEMENSCKQIMKSVQAFGGIDAWRNRYKSEVSPLEDLPLKILLIYLYSENGQYTSICDSQSKQRVYDDFKSTRSLQSRSSHQAEPQSSVASGKVPGLPRTTVPAPKSSVRYDQYYISSEHLKSMIQ
eukprot:503520_1